jgi:hypothetical protein
MQQLQFTFTLEETNMLLTALGHQSYTQVFQLIQKIQAQASAQLPANNTPGFPPAPQS